VGLFPLSCVQAAAGGAQRGQQLSRVSLIAVLMGCSDLGVFFDAGRSAGRAFGLLSAAWRFAFVFAPANGQAAGRIGPLRHVEGAERGQPLTPDLRPFGSRLGFQPRLEATV